MINLSADVHGALDRGMHGLGLAMHELRINPQTVTIVLRRDDFWALLSLLRADRTMSRYVPNYDGRGQEPGDFLYMGFRFAPEEKR